MAVGAYDLTLGAISIGTNLNFWFFGLVTYQFAHYYDSNYRDSFTIRALVLWMLLLDTFHTAICGYTLWDYTITHFDQPDYAFAVDWIYNLTPTITALTSTPVQLFLAWRVYLLTKSKLLLAIIGCTAIAQGLAAVGTTIGAFMLNDVFLFPRLRPVVGLWFSLQIVCDFMITSSLVWTLSKNRTGYRTTDHVLNRLMRASVETALFATIFCVLDMCTFFGYPGTHLHIIFAFPMGRIYSNSLLGTLNARASHRNNLDASNTEAPTWPGFKRTQASGTAVDRGDITTIGMSDIKPITIGFDSQVTTAMGNDEYKVSKRTIHVHSQDNLDSFDGLKVQRENADGVERQPSPLDFGGRLNV